MHPLHANPGALTLGGNWLLYTDGAARGNPGPAAIGAVLYRDDDGRMHEVDTVSETIGVATNNVAEYKAVIAGLKMAAARTPQLLIVRADSLLLIRQLAGRYRVRNANLQPLHREAMELLAPMSYRLQHVRREQNTRADDLANAALDRG